jgi:hypothetical protein
VSGSAEALDPRYRPASDGSIPLYEGPIELDNKGVATQGMGSIEFAWVPASEIRFQLTSSDWLPTEECTLSIPGATGKALVTKARMGTGESEASGILPDGLERYTADPTTVVFHVVNLPEIYGTPIAGGARQRLTLETDRWSVTLDSLGGEELFDELKASGGFGVTHIGALTRPDGAVIRVEEAVDVLIAVDWALSFAAGHHVGVVLPVGHHGDPSTPSWEYWRAPKVDPLRSRFSWSSRRNGKGLEEVAELFLRLRDEDAYWRKMLPNLVGMYLEANGGGALQLWVTTIVMALDLLAWAVVVEDRSAMTAEGYDRLRGSDSLRLLLAWPGVSTTIPSELKSLSEWAKKRHIVDGPHGISEVRNSIVHPKKSQANSVDWDVMIDAWKLAMWYFEVALLWKLGYQGRHLCRWRNSLSEFSLEPVPWA